MSDRRKTGDQVSCWQCGSTFRFDAQEMRQDRKYCGRDCYRESRRLFDTRPYPEVWHNGKKIYLHQMIWMEANPDETLMPGDIIHHIDENPFNRDPSNLERLTGDSRAQHLHRHNYFRRGRREVDYEKILSEYRDEDDEIPF